MTKSHRSKPKRTKSPSQKTNSARLSQLQSHISQYDPSWLFVPISTPDVKFALHTRLLALTSHPLPDPLLNSANLTTQQILNHILLPHTKPKKLADALLMNEKLTSLPNVAVYDRRIRPIDREVQVGRWKEIVRALEEKGLPVTGGHLSEGRNRQKKVKRV